MYVKQNKNAHYNFLAKNIFWLQLGRILTRGCSLLALPVVTAFLAPEAFGIIALFVVEASFLAGFYSLGLGSFAARMIYKYDRRNKQTCRNYLGVILFYLLIFSSFGAIVSLPLTGVIKRVIFKDVFFPHPFLFYIPVIQAFFLSIYGFSSNCFLSFQENKKVFICELLAFLLLVPAKIIGLVWFSFTWVEVVILQMLSWVIVGITSLWLIRKNLGFSFRRLKIIKYALRYSLPYVPMNFSAWIQQQIDKIFLGRMHGVSCVGVYAVGMKFSEAYRAFSRPIATSLKPEVSKRLDMRHDNVNRDIRDFLNLFFQFSLFVIFSVSIFSREIVSLLSDVKYSNAFKVIPFMMAGIMLAELKGIFQLKFVYKNKTLLFPLLMFLGALLNASLNYCLIPKFGILGACFATVLANLITLFICYFISQRLHFTGFNMTKNFSAFIVIALFIFFIQGLSPSVPMVLLKFVGIICYAVILYSYFLHNNKRFRQMQETFVMAVKARLKI